MRINYWNVLPKITKATIFLYKGDKTTNQLQRNEKK